MDEKEALEHAKLVEREQLKDHGDEYKELPTSVFAEVTTEPGPTPQGKPGDSREYRHGNPEAKS